MYASLFIILYLYIINIPSLKYSHKTAKKIIKNNKSILLKHTNIPQTHFFVQF